MAYIKLKDIAQKANVSINTVSRALNDRDDIGDDTKIRIRRIADEMGYILNASASRLRSKENKMIGVIITHIDNAFYSSILQGINDALSEVGFTLLTLSSGDDLKKEESLLKTLVANRVAGTIIVPSMDLVNSLDYDHLGVPHITIVRKGNKNTRSFFITDSYESGKIAGHHFGSRGYKNPGYIGYNLPVSCNSDRQEGFKHGLKEYGINLSINQIILCNAKQQDAYEGVKNLLNKNANIDSIFVYNDLMALGVLKALYDLGLNVPGDISVLGHDDIIDSGFYTPSLSTIKVPKYRLGYDSAKELLALIKDNNTPEKNVTYRPELILRNS